MMPAAATSRDQSETLFATPAIVAERRADGSIILKSTTPLREARVASATGWSIGRGRPPTGFFSATAPASMRRGRPSPTGTP